MFNLDQNSVFERNCNVAVHCEIPTIKLRILNRCLQLNDKRNDYYLC